MISPVFGNPVIRENGGRKKTMAQRNDLTRKDIDELYAILQKAEEEMK